MGGFHVNLYRPGDDKVAELLTRQGDIAAQRAAQSGQIWGNALSNVGQQAGQAVQQYGKQQEDKKVGAAITAGAAGGGIDLQAILRTVPQNRAAEVLKAIESAQSVRAATEERTAKAQQLMAANQRAVTDSIGVSALRIKSLMPSATDGGLGLLTALHADAKAHGLKGADEFDAPLQQAGTALQQAQASGDPNAVNAVKDQIRQWAAPHLDRLGLGVSQEAMKGYLAEKSAGEYTLAKDAKRFGLNNQLLADNPDQDMKLQSEDLLINGQSVKGTFEPKTGRYYYRGQIVDNPQKPPPARDPLAEALANERLTNAKSSRTDASYKQARTQLDTLQKPIIDKVERLQELTDLLNQRTPEADALIAPKLMTAIAGGAGSGVRVTQPEINSINNARNVWDGLLAKAKQFSTDPEAALKIMDSQRDQIRRLVAPIQERVQSKASLISKAGEDLLDPNADVNTHRKVVATLKDRLTQGETGTASPKQIKTDADYNALASGTEFIAPDGSRRRKP